MTKEEAAAVLEYMGRTSDVRAFSLSEAVLNPMSLAPLAEAIKTMNDIVQAQEPPKEEPKAPEAPKTDVE